MSSPVQLDLSQDEGLVLFAFLHRMREAGSEVFEDQAEQRILWDLEAALEAKLDAVLDPAYAELLASARDRVRD